MVTRAMQALRLAALAAIVACTPWPKSPPAVSLCGDEGQRCCERMSCTNQLRCDNNVCGRCGASEQFCNGACIARTATCVARQNLDVLFVIDNSNSMAENQRTLAQNAGAFFDLLNAQTDPATGRPLGSAVQSVHLGFVSTDLGTPGSNIPSCAASDTGDDGRMNPMRNGAAMMTHQPWRTAPPGVLPARCSMDLGSYANFLTFDPSVTSPGGGFNEDFVCNALFSIGGCGLEQPLEAAYRALIIHDPRERAGNDDPNAGFLRDDSVLVIVIISDEEDGSVRDCRYAIESERATCRDAISVYDITSAAWAGTELNLRFYLYSPGSAQDPTWPVERYTSLTTGFPSLKPRSPQRVIFAAITGVPIQLPTTTGDGGAQSVDWNRLLGTAVDGSGGLVATSPEGMVSMKQANRDPACASRVVPACRREGTAPTTTCSASEQYFAWPARRIARVARYFDESLQGGGVISSICRNDYSPTLRDVARLVRQRFSTP